MVTAFWRGVWGINSDLCANGDLHLWTPIPLLAGRAGSLVLEAASPRTNA